MARADGGDMAEGRREEASLPGSGKEPPLDSASEKLVPHARVESIALRGTGDGCGILCWQRLEAHAVPPCVRTALPVCRGLPSVGQQQGPGLEPSVGQGLFFRRELKCFTW